MGDIDKFGVKNDYSPDGSQSVHYGSQESYTKGMLNRWADSFKRDPNAHATPKGAVGADGKVYDVEGAAANTANSPLARQLKGRHLQMIGELQRANAVRQRGTRPGSKNGSNPLSSAIGGSIGTGLFVASGSSLAQGGPASLLIAYGIIGIMLYCTVHALGEMAVLFPVAGSFSAYSTRFLDPAWGFAMGWK